jgi:hypothetical protein
LLIQKELGSGCVAPLQSDLQLVLHYDMIAFRASFTLATQEYLPRSESAQ